MANKKLVIPDGSERDKDETEWMVVERPELRIIEDETFEKAQEILRGRHDAFNLSHERQSNKHLFSTLIKCKECGWSFRRTVRTYKNTYVRWVCSGRNGRGVDSCLIKRLWMRKNSLKFCRNILQMY